MSGRLRGCQLVGGGEGQEVPLALDDGEAHASDQHYGPYVSSQEEAQGSSL